MATDLAIQQILESAPDAVPMPATATAILQKSRQPDTSRQEIADLFKSDAALTARVLRIVNSAYYGLPPQVGDVDNAVMLLGQQTIRNLVLTATMGGLGGQGVAGYGLGKGGLFNHSLVVAQSAQTLSKEGHKSIPAEAYTAGLLHDIGKVVLAQHVEQRITIIVETAQASGVSFGEAERQVLGLNHAEVGATLAEKWELPDFLVGAIRAHHAAPPGDCSDDTTTLAATCIVANQVSRQAGAGVRSNETPDPEIPSVVSDILVVNRSDFDELKEMLHREIEQTMSILQGGNGESENGQSKGD
jgi:putative nucleotidyltransferase with HDIG domain